MKDKEVLYLKWKVAYYKGETLVSDITFDTLENELKNLGSQFVNIVDAPNKREIKNLNYFTAAEITEIFGKDDNDRKERFTHLSPMLSLQKIQIENEDSKPYHDIELFLSRTNSDTYESTSKYDGNSLEIIYKDGILFRALTRGNKSEGIDKTHKIKEIVPNTININGTIEVRGELIIETDIWKEKYRV